MNLEIITENRSEFGPVRDQGPLPTCLSHATSSVHQTVQDFPNQLSAEALHYYATDGDLRIAASINGVSNALQVEGQPAESDCDPVLPDNIDTWSPPNGVNTYCSASKQIETIVSTLIEIISQDELPVLGVSLPEKFYEPTPPWIISAGTPVTTHAVVGVGIAQSDDGTLVLIRNSWGEDWGDSGHAWINEEFIHEHLMSVMLLTGDT